MVLPISRKKRHLEGRQTCLNLLDRIVMRTEILSLPSKNFKKKNLL